MMKSILTIASLFFLSSCSSPESPKLIPKPFLTNVKVAKITENDVTDPKVDILFVVDNSGSMSGHQKNVADNIGRFVSTFFNHASINYHIGVLSTDMEAYQQTMCCGRLHGDPVFVDSRMPNPAGDLADRLVLGTNGSATEQSFEPVLSALKGPNESGANKGFLRKNAHLAIIFITDAEDQSKISPKELYDALMTIKLKRERILGYGAIIPSGMSGAGCERDDSYTEPKRIEQFLGMMFNSGNNIFSLCGADFGDKLAGIAEDIAKLVSRTVYLNRAPIVSTIKVFFGTQLIPNDSVVGWTFEPELNAIVLADKLVLDENQPEDSKITYEFEAASYLEQK